jgi:hypothetical protein
MELNLLVELHKLGAKSSTHTKAFERSEPRGANPLGKLDFITFGLTHSVYTYHRDNIFGQHLITSENIWSHFDSSPY